MSPKTVVIEEIEKNLKNFNDVTKNNEKIETEEEKENDRIKKV